MNSEIIGSCLPECRKPVPLHQIRLRGAATQSGFRDHREGTLHLRSLRPSALGFVAPEQGAQRRRARVLHWRPPPTPPSHAPPALAAICRIDIPSLRGTMAYAVNGPRHWSTMPGPRRLGSGFKALREAGQPRRVKMKRTTTAIMAAALIISTTGAASAWGTIHKQQGKGCWNIFTKKAWSKECR